MVHGNYYGIQYEIHLTKELDFYDELLPIWMEVRARIEMTKDKYTGVHKLILIPYNDFSKILYNNKLFKSYVSENDNYRYSSKKHMCEEEEYVRRQHFFFTNITPTFMTILQKH